MTQTTHDVAIIGAGQAGLATSFALAGHGIGAVVLERGRIGEAWLSQRWDSFCLVTPNWTITLPGAPYTGQDPGGFLSRDAWVDHLNRWARIAAPDLRCGVEVHALKQARGGFRLDTSAGPIQAREVVVATGTHQRVRPPRLWDSLDGHAHQIMATEYRNPSALPPGGVLVVGAGQSGCQIAEELHAAGRPTALCVGNAGRLPRRYRGRDCIEWQDAMGWLDRTPAELSSPALRFRGDPHVTGQGGGRTISLHHMARSGIRLLGRLQEAEGNRLHLAPTLHDGLCAADTYATEFCEAVNSFLDRTGQTAPAPIEDLGFATGRWCPESPATFDLRQEGVSTVIWATGFGFDFGWIDAPVLNDAVLDDTGYPVTDQGASPVPGLYFMGLNWMTRRKSGIIYGVAQDAASVAARIAAYLGGGSARTPAA